MPQDSLQKLARSTTQFGNVHLRALAIFLGVGFVLIGILQLTSRSSALRGVQIGEARFGNDKEIILKNGQGVEVHVLTLGAVVRKLLVPDKNGVLGDVVLGFDDLEPYKDGTSPYFGAVVGRVANRIANATFSLNGTKYNLSANDPPNSLHGGIWGWSRKSWRIVSREVFDDGGCALKLEYVSGNLEEGFPGKVVAGVTYSLLASSTLRIDFEATTTAATPINMAQHAYFNLEGVAQPAHVLDHTLQINSSHVTPVDAVRIPTGEFLPVKGSAFDFSEPRRIGERILEVPGPPPGGYDVNYVLWGRDGAEALQNTKDCVALSEPGLAARVHAPSSGRTLEVLTNSPGLQFYSGNMLDGSLKGKDGVSYPQYGGFALETQMFPAFVNRQEFPTCILEPGQTYHVTDVWRFSAE